MAIERPPADGAVPRTRGADLGLGLPPPLPTLMAAAAAAPTSGSASGSNVADDAPLSIRRTSGALGRRRLPVDLKLGEGWRWPAAAAVEAVAAVVVT